MAKSPKLEIPAQLDATASKKDDKKSKNNKNNKNKKANGKTRRSFVKFCRDILSELKKVSWAKMKSTKNNKGVLNQTGMVLLVVLCCMIVLTAVDLGLAELLSLLIQAA